MTDKKTSFITNPAHVPPGWPLASPAPDLMAGYDPWEYAEHVHERDEDCEGRYLPPLPEDGRE